MTEEYVGEMMTPQSRENSCYGLLTWLLPNQDPTKGICRIAPSEPMPDGDMFPESFPRDAFFLSGFLGQMVIVVPEEQTVLVTMGYAERQSLGDNHVATVMAEAFWCTALGKC